MIADARAAGARDDEQGAAACNAVIALIRPMDSSSSGSQLTEALDTTLAAVAEMNGDDGPLTSPLAPGTPPGCGDICGRMCRSRWEFRHVPCIQKTCIRGRYLKTVG